MLTREQIIANIDAMEKQGASRGEIQSWLDSLKTQPKAIAKITPESMKATGGFKGIATKIADFLGPEKLARGIGYGLESTFDPEFKKQISYLEQQKALTPEEIQTVKTGGVTPKQMAGSVLQTGLTAATPAIRGLGSAIKLGSAIGLADELQQDDQFQTGRALQKMVVGSILTTGTLGVGKVLGKAIQFAKGAPEKLYGQIYKATADDVQKNFTTEAMKELQAKQPEVFSDYVKKGIIRISGNIPIVNPTLAKEALDRGLKGNLEAQAQMVMGKQWELESQIRNLVQKEGVNVTVPNKKGYIGLLKNLDDEFTRQGHGFYADKTLEAKQLVSSFEKIKGNKIPAELALRTRRFLDNMRNTSSFRLNTKLSPKQEAYKMAADSLRKSLADQVPNIKSLMNEYRFNIDAFDSLVKEAVKRNNLRLLGLTDILVGGGGIASGFPGTGLGAMFAIRGFQAPTVLTNVAQGLQKGITGLQAGIQKTGLGQLGAITKELQYPILSEIEKRLYGE
jgi:hypothetical protein